LSCCSVAIDTLQLAPLAVDADAVPRVCVEGVRACVRRVCVGCAFGGVSGSTGETERGGATHPRRGGGNTPTERGEQHTNTNAPAPEAAAL
jgi:hypothetical protein